MSLTYATIANSVSRRLPGAGRRRRLQSFFLAIALALLSVPTGVAWAKGPSQTGGDSRQAQIAATTTTKTTTTPVTTEAAPSQAASYAAREASAKGLENFKGGDTVVIGGSALLIILLIVLIIVLV